MAAPYRAGTLMTEAEIDKQTHGLRVKYEYRKNLAPPSDPDFHTRKAMVRLFLALARGAPRERPCGKSSHVITEVLTRGHLEVWEDAMVASCCGGVFGSTVDELASMLRRASFAVSVGLRPMNSSSFVARTHSYLRWQGARRIAEIGRIQQFARANCDDLDSASGRDGDTKSSF